MNQSENSYQQFVVSTVIAGDFGEIINTQNLDNKVTLTPLIELFANVLIE